MKRELEARALAGSGRSPVRIPALMLTLVVAAAAVAGAYAYSRVGPAPTYVTAPIQRGTVATLVKATGTVNAVLTVDVGSQISGRMADVLVNFNDEVKAGQPIAQVEPETYVAKVNEAKAALNIALAAVNVQRASIERSRAALGNARVARSAAEAQRAAIHINIEELDRQLQRKLALARTASVTEADLTKTRADRDVQVANERAAIEQIGMRGQEIAMAEAELRMAEANLQSAEAVVEQKRAALDQTEVDLQRTVIRAPIDGIVIKRSINPGQTVAVSLEAKTLFKIANDLREMEVHGKVDEADVGLLKVGQPVNFTVDAYPDRTFSGRVLQIRKSPEIAMNVVTYTAVISAPNPDQLLFPGMTANLQITIDEVKDALKVPNQALRFRPAGDASAAEQGAGAERNGATVWVLNEEGKPVPVRLAVGKSDNTGTQLVSGPLAEGQRVIVGTAAAPLRPGLFGLKLWF